MVASLAARSEAGGVIDAIDLALKRLLEEQLARPVSGVAAKGFEVTFEPPGEVKPNPTKPRINLYLYDVTENVQMRNDPFQVMREPGRPMAKRKRSKVHVDLSYVVSVHADDATSEHRLLALVLAAFLRNPTFAPRHLEGSSFETEARLHVAQPSGDKSNVLTSIWPALGGPLRAALALQVTASFDPFETEEIRVVREMIVGLGFMHEGEFEGRPNQVRSHRVSVAGLVYDADNQPLAGAAICVKDRPEKAASDDRGFFYLTNLPSGPQTLLVHLRGHRSFETSFEAPPPGLANEAETVMIQLAQRGVGEEVSHEISRFGSALEPRVYDAERVHRTTIAGRLFLEDGRPAAYVPVRTGDARTVTDLEGRYHFFTWERGDTVWATYPGLGEVAVEVREGAGKLPASPEAAVK